MAVIKDFMLGNGRVVIYDDYFIPEEEIQKNLDEIGEIYVRSILRQALREQQDAE